MSTQHAKDTQPASYWPLAWVGLGAVVVMAVGYTDLSAGPVRTQQMITIAYADLNTAWVWLLMLTLAVAGVVAMAVTSGARPSTASWWLSRSGRCAVLVAVFIGAAMVAVNPAAYISISS